MFKTTMRSLAWIAVLALGLSVASAAGSAGSVDSTYGTSGVADGGAFYVEDAVVLPDGSVLLAGIDQSGATETFAVKKIDRYGELVTNFGSSGIAAVLGAPPRSQNWARTIAVGPDGRIFVGGQRTYTTQVTSGRGKKQTTEDVDVTTGSILALNADGSIDMDFGEDGDGYLDGMVPADLAVRGTSASYDLLIATTAAVQVEVAGSGRGKKGGTQTVDTLALAIHAVDGFTGADVTSFGTNGTMVDDLSETTNDRPLAMQIDGLGRIVVMLRYDDAFSSVDEVKVCRYSSTGVLDTTLGTNGRLSVPGGNEYLHNRLAIDGDGERILIAYRNRVTTSESEAVVVRYAATGSTLDTTFDVPQIAGTSDTTTVYDTWPSDLDVDANGKVCVTLWSGADNWDVTIVRCNADGTRDTGFGPNVDGLSENLDLSDTEKPRATLIDSSGRLILINLTAEDPVYDTALIRYDG